MKLAVSINAFVVIAPAFEAVMVARRRQNHASARVIFGGDLLAQHSIHGLDAPAASGTSCGVCNMCETSQVVWPARVASNEDHSSLHRRLNSISAALSQTFGVVDHRNRRVRLTGNDARKVAVWGPEDSEDVLR